MAAAATWSRWRRRVGFSQRDRPAAPDFAPADVMTVRRLIEPQALPLVVLWATARDFAEMERCLAMRRSRRQVTRSSKPGQDLALHRCIIAAAQVPAAGRAVGGVVLFCPARTGLQSNRGRSATRQRRDLYQEDHQAIVTALRARDADGAVAAMRTHLARRRAPPRRDAPTRFAASPCGSQLRSPGPCLLWVPAPSGASFTPARAKSAKRAPEPLTMRPRATPGSKAWRGPAIGSTADLPPRPWATEWR